MSLRSSLPNRCKHCKVRMPADKAHHVIHNDCIEPWLAIQQAKKKRKAEREKRVAAVIDRRLTKEKLEKHKTIAELIAAAQIPFNLFIRLRDKDKGCFVCSRPFTTVPGQVQHAGHVRSRGAAGHLRFNESNCLGECEGCNGPHGAKPHQIKAGAIARIGQERYDVLDNDNAPHKWGRDELIAIKADYTAKAKALKGTP